MFTVALGWTQTHSARLPGPFNTSRRLKRAPVFLTSCGPRPTPTAVRRTARILPTCAGPIGLRQEHTDRAAVRASPWTRAGRLPTGLRGSSSGSPS
jgi:hypothetical protein